MIRTDMKRTALLLLAASSVFFGTLGSAARRPRYGGALHVAVRTAPTSLNPSQPGWVENRNLFGLMFDTLAVLDEQGRPRPWLATSWQEESGAQRWVFVMRHNVAFQDGTPLTAEAVAASLRGANPAWKVFSSGDSVMIEVDSPSPNLTAELALARNSIVKQAGDKFVGTGPFAVSRWEPRKSLVVTAREDYWAGRPFLDAIEIDLGRNLQDQTVSFDLGKTQLIDVATEQARRAANDGRKIEMSPPDELIALIFSTEPSTPAEKKLRDAFSLSIDRKTLNSVVLQDGGQGATGLLPQWLSGYEYLFSVESGLTRAQQERAEVPQAGVWRLGYDSNDPIQHLIADRIVLNARDAGLRVQLANSSGAEARLVRMKLASLSPQIALEQMAATLGLKPPRLESDSVEELYAAERTLLQSGRVIPLLHLRTAYAVSNNVRGVAASDGSWRLNDAWLAEKP